MAYCSLSIHCAKRIWCRVGCRIYSSSTNAGTLNNNSTNQITKVTFREKFKETWDGPNFKYWFIGTSGFLSWLAYYSLKAYKKKCIKIEILPHSPNHETIQRQGELKKLFEIYGEQSSLFSRKTVKKMVVSGPSGSGKTVLINQFVQKCQQIEHSKYGLPKSNVTVFLQANSEALFLASLKSFASKLNILMSDLDELLAYSGNKFYNATFKQKCEALVQCIQEKLEKHPGWIVVIDDIKSTTPNSVFDVIVDIFLKDDENWSSGTFILVEDNAKEFPINNVHKHTMEKGMTHTDSYQFIQEIIKFDECFVAKDTFEKLVEKVFSNPLAVLCAGMLLKEKLANENEMKSINGAINELCKEIEENVRSVLKKNEHLASFTSTVSGLKLVTIETVVAMNLKRISNKDRYLHNGFDLISTLSPGTPIPQAIMARHLLNPFYKLPSLATSTSILDFMSKQKRDMEEVKSKTDEFEPKGKAWSSKNLAKYVKKIEEFFETTYNTVKDIYNLIYGELPPLPEKDDGLTMFASCELLQHGTLEPGGTKALSVHPIVYNVARQQFLSNISTLEYQHLEESRQHYNNQSWYKRLSGFSEQACLQTLRNNCGVTDSAKSMKQQTADALLFRYNMGIDVSQVLKTDRFSGQSGVFWYPSSREQVRYLQDHLKRVVTSLCDQIDVTKEDLAGFVAKKYLMTHLEYILQNHSSELIGTESQIQGCQTMARCFAQLNKDTNSSKNLLDHVLTLQNSSPQVNPLNIAKTLTEQAQFFVDQGNTVEARELLERASQMYDSHRKRFGEYKRPTEYGKMLGLLGTVYGTLKMKIESKETIERALMLQQSVAPDTSDEEKTKKFGSEFASSLIDLGHAYVSLGLPLYGKKILDLALAAQKNLNGENHPEVVRATTVLAIAHLLQGHNEESKKLRKEAGKIQAAINKMPLY